MGSDKGLNSPNNAKIVVGSSNSSNNAAGVTQSGENSHQYLKMVTNGSQWCDLCKASISHDLFFIGCLSNFTKKINCENCPSRFISSHQ